MKLDRPLPPASSPAGTPSAQKADAKPTAPLTETPADEGAEGVGTRGATNAHATDAFVPATPATPAAAQSRDLDALLGKFGLTQEKKPVTEKRFAANVRRFVTQLAERTKKIAQHGFSVMRAFGLAVRHCSSMHDIRQLQDFAKLAIKNGQPTAVFSILQDVAGFILKYPDDARRVMKFVAAQEQQMTAQRTAWMRPALVDVSALPKAPPQKADIVVIGGGISAAYMSRSFADAQKGGDASAQGRSLLVLEKDDKRDLAHMASLRNAGIVCTALDYIFDIDEIVGDRAVTRIQDALKLDRPNAERVYGTLMRVMHDATGTIQQFLKDKNVDVELKPAGGLDVAHTAEDVEAFRKAAALAREHGLDWEAIEKETLKAQYGIDAPGIEGALRWNDSAQLHPGKLVEALFKHATSTTKDVHTSYGTEVLGAEEDKQGGGWILHTRARDADGNWVARDIHANEVIDAREAYAPYHFREARFSQIHIIDTTQDDRPMHLDDTHVCHGFTYMRKVADNKFLVGSGDFPLSDPHDTPPLMASVALYAFANFMKVFPDAKFDLEKAWGGVFGLNHSEVPCVGELLKGWQVVGGSGGSGMNLTPALGAQAIANVLGRAESGPMSAPGFSPRQYALIDLRTELVRALQQFARFEGIDVTRVELEVGARNTHALTQRGDALVFTIDEATLDAANVLAAPLYGDQAQAQLEARTAAKGAYVDAMMKVVARGLKDGKTLVLSPTPDGSGGAGEPATGKARAQRG